MQRPSITGCRPAAGWRGRAAACALLALLVSGAARGESAVNVTDLSATYGTFGTTPQLCVPPADARATLFLYNSGSTSIGYSFGPAPALGAAGTVTLPAGGAGWVFWGPGAAPRQPIFCVSSGAGAQLTILVGND
ncbi:MAG TPA: hypothetical protein VFA22_09225 [Stellaceae bacterium]|nr:hypothetical protein [Stellaceae bacterium]